MSKTNKVARAMYEAQKEGSKITASIRLKKNGRFSSVSGIVEDLKVSRDGFPYATVNKGKGKYQTVRLENVLCVNKDNKVYKK